VIDLHHCQAIGSRRDDRVRHAVNPEAIRVGLEGGEELDVAADTLPQAAHVVRNSVEIDFEDIGTH